MKDGIEIFIVFGDTGSHEDHKQWIVDCWWERSAAQRRVAELNGAAAMFRLELEKIGERYPYRTDNDDRGSVQFERWMRAVKRAEKYHQRLGGDDQLEAYDPSPSYSVGFTMLRGSPPAKKTPSPYDLTAAMSR